MGCKPEAPLQIPMNSRLVSSKFYVFVVLKLVRAYQLVLVGNCPWWRVGLWQGAVRLAGKTLAP